MSVEMIASGCEENETDFRGFVGGNVKALGGSIADTGDGRTPSLLETAGAYCGIVRFRVCRGCWTIGEFGVAMLSLGSAVMSLSFIIPGLCPAVGNFIPVAGGRNGDATLGLGSTTVFPPIMKPSFLIGSSSSDDEVADDTSSPDQNFPSSSSESEP